MFIINQDCRAGMAEHLADCSVDAIVTDPPYGLSKEPNAAEVLRHWLNGDDYTHTGGGFMGKAWDSFVPGPATWAEAFRVLKPGGYALVFAGSRTQDLMTVALRLAGFEIRDAMRYWYDAAEPATPQEAKAAAQTGGGLAWLYGSGFPKSLDVGKAVDQQDATNERRERALRFTAWMRSTGVTAAQINEATGTNMASHYLTDKSQPAVATLDLFEKMRRLLPEPPADIMELMQWRTVESENMKRREVVGRRATGIGTGGGSTLIVRDSDNKDITAPHTEAAKQWHGWGTALKPAYEPVIIARKPLTGTVADNVLTHGTGAINVEGCRIRRTAGDRHEYGVNGDEPSRAGNGVTHGDRVAYSPAEAGRWPANVLHDGCLDDETWSRYFYCAKTSKADRNAGLEHLEALSAGEVAGGRAEGSDGLKSPRAGAGRTSGAKNPHPTVKPTELMRYLCRLVTPPGGLVLDPFAGSGSTGRGAVLEGFNFIGFEMDPQYAAVADLRILDAFNQFHIDGTDNKA